MPEFWEENYNTLLRNIKEAYENEEIYTAHYLENSVS